MRSMERRAFLGGAMAGFPVALMGQSIKTTTSEIDRLPETDVTVRS